MTAADPSRRDSLDGATSRAASLRDDAAAARRALPRRRAGSAAAGRGGRARRSTAPAGPCSTSAAAPAATSTRSRAGACSALGVDVSPVAVALARAARRDASSRRRSSIAVPGAGSWNSALLLDGNIGIGGAPDALLRRARRAARAAAGPSSSSSTRRARRRARRGVRLEDGGARERVVRVGAGRRRRGRPGRRARRVCACGRAGATAGAGSPSCRRHEGAARAVPRESFWRSPLRGPWLTTHARRAAAARSCSSWRRPASSRTPPTSPTSGATRSSRRRGPAAAGLRLAGVAVLALRAHPGPARERRARGGPVPAGQAVVGDPAAVRVAAGARPRARDRAAVARAAGRRRDLRVRHGILNAQFYYPFHFNFVVAHYYGAWVFLAALAIHVAIKLPVIVRA